MAWCELQLVLREADRSACEPGPKREEGIAKLKDEWARTMGEPELVSRVARLDDQLRGMQPSKPNDQGRHSMIDEYVKMREEREKLQARINQLRSDLVAKNKITPLQPEPPKPENVTPRTNVPVALVRQSYVDGVNDKRGTYKGRPLPEFVLVLTPDLAGAVAPLPMPAEAAK